MEKELDVMNDKSLLRRQIHSWKENKESVAYVPTMGSLHEGHIGLVRLALSHADRVVVSIFINPTQFDRREDFKTYPSSLDLDISKLSDIPVDILFAPNIETIYPFGAEDATVISEPSLTKNLCGKYRPGHFDGVASVLIRFFNIIQPDIAVFGQKDYQQILVVKRLVKDINLPIKILSGPIQREVDGLAMSSRNQFLSDRERLIAPEFYKFLKNIVTQIKENNRNFYELEKESLRKLQAKGFKPEYVKVRHADKLQEPNNEDRNLVLIAAVKLGKVRLIDNICFSL